MPRIYLSPSTQEANLYVTGSGSEENSMNLLADALEPYLYANAISFVRNTPQMTAASSIAQANAMGGFDFYLALHSNAAGAGREGQVRGVIVFYYPASRDGARAAEIFAANLRDVYPLPNLVRAEATVSLGEVRRTRFPANLLELGYHDNADDARWVESSRESIAANLALSLTEYFSLPFFHPLPAAQAAVRTDGAPLRLREYPDAAGRVLAAMPNGAAVTVYGARQGWNSLRYNGILGYAAQAYIQM